MALFCYLLSPLHALAPASAAPASTTRVICTGQGLTTIQLPSEAPVSPAEGASCPACLSCPFSGCAGMAPALTATTAPAFAPVAAPAQVATERSFARAGRDWRGSPPRAPPIRR